MPSPFQEIANLRLLVRQPPTSLNFRSGVTANTAAWVIEAYAEGETVAAADLPSVSPRSRILTGYLTRWAVLPTGGNWLAAASAFTWTDTGLAPAGLTLGMSGRGFLGVLPSLPTKAGTWLEGEATILGLSEPFGPGGIGAELRSAGVEKLRIELQVPA